MGVPRISTAWNFATVPVVLLASWKFPHHPELVPFLVLAMMVIAALHRIAEALEGPL